MCHAFRRVGGITVSIAAFQAVDPGSTPGRRSNLFTCVIVTELVWSDRNVPELTGFHTLSFACKASILSRFHLTFRLSRGNVSRIPSRRWYNG
ncbi:hypothetical protein AVEN_64283-1 [Araneus ventricosus]|uniref:Uncharacterized protein n=1 Tax=Araneus ventricosus TaxID=182803 RepID=A0A4Y2MX33_ARAVE|nr:hypothetical protein AVEN_64283-1 [Araneus ventricosus]